MSRVAIAVAVLSGLTACPGREPSGGGEDAAVLADAGTDAEAADCLGDVQSPTATKACACVTDCDPDEACVSELDFGVPGGVCLRTCDVDDDCPDGTACDPQTGCMQECATTVDCRAGFVCSRIRGEGPLLCQGLCQDDDDCPTTGTCDLATGLCGDAGVHPGTGEVGAACDSDLDCLSGFCGQGAAFPGGYCTAFCSVSRQGCPAGGPCFANSTPDDDMGHCLAHCDDDTDCRQDEGYFCGYSPELPDATFCGTS